MILDDEKSLKKASDISNRILSEIALQKHYPKQFVEVARKALEERGAVIEQEVQEERRILTIKAWIERQPGLFFVAIIAAIFSGLVGFFVVVTSVIIALNPSGPQDHQRKWNYVALVLLLVNLILLVLTYYLIT